MWKKDIKKPAPHRLASLTILALSSILPSGFRPHIQCNRLTARGKCYALGRKAISTSKQKPDIIIQNGAPSAVRIVPTADGINTTAAKIISLSCVVSRIIGFQTPFIITFI